MSLDKSILGMAKLCLELHRFTVEELLNEAKAACVKQIIVAPKRYSQVQAGDSLTPADEECNDILEGPLLQGIAWASTEMLTFSATLILHASKDSLHMITPMKSRIWGKDSSQVDGPLMESLQCSPMSCLAVMAYHVPRGSEHVAYAAGEGEETNHEIEEAKKVHHMTTGLQAPQAQPVLGGMPP